MLANPRSKQYQRDVSAFVPTGLTVLTVVAVGYVLVVGRGILLPFVCALFLWTLLTGLADAIDRIPARYLPLRLPYAARLLIALLVVAGTLWFLGDVVTQNFRRVTLAAPRYQTRLEEILEQLLDTTEIPVQEALRPLDLTRLLTSIIGGITYVAGQTGAVVLYTLFLFLEGHTFPLKMRAMVADPTTDLTLQDTLRRIGDQIRRYLAVKTFTSSLVALLSFVVLWSVGVDFAGFWGVLTFILNFIPYIGSFFAVLFPAFLTLLQFKSLTTFLVTTALLLTCQFTVGSILEPRIMGRSLNLSPLVILLSLATWGAMWGVVGMFLGIPLMVALMIVLAQFDRSRPIAILLSERGTVAAPHSPPET